MGWIESLQFRPRSFVNVKDYGAVGNGVANDTEAIQKSIAACIAIGGGIVYLPPGSYAISATLLIDNISGVLIRGAGVEVTVITSSTSALNNLPMVRFEDTDRCGIEHLSLHGNVSAPPSCGVNFHSEAPSGFSPTACFMENVRIGSNASNNIVDGVRWTASALGANNDLTNLSRVRIVNMSGVGFNIGHENSLGHLFTACDVSGGGSGAFKLAGGSFTAVGCSFSNSGWILDLLAGVYHHSIMFFGCIVESDATWIRSSAAITSRVALFCSATEFKSGSVNATMVDWAAPEGTLSFNSCQLFTGQPGTRISISGGISIDFSLVGCEVGVSNIDYSGQFTDIGNAYISAPTFTNLGAGKHVQINSRGSGIDSAINLNGGILKLDSGLQVRSGSGSPEGVITAPVGSLFLRSNGGVGTTLYIKESGVGNTGWAAK